MKDYVEIEVELEKEDGKIQEILDERGEDGVEVKIESIDVLSDDFVCLNLAMVE